MARLNIVVGVVGICFILVLIVLSLNLIVDSSTKNETQWRHRGRLADADGPYVPYGYLWGSGPWTLMFNDTALYVEVDPMNGDVKQYTLMTEDSVVVIDCILKFTNKIPVGRPIYIWRAQGRAVISFPEDHLNATGGWILD